MNIFQAYKMAIKSIRANKVRSFLTMLGVIIGVASVIAAVAFAQGSTKNITESIQGLGTNLININIMGRNSNRNISYEDIKEFAEKNSEIIAAVAPTVNGSVTVKYGTKNCDTTLIGTNSDYAAIKSIKTQRGRFIMPIDDEYSQKIAVVGTAVVEEIFEGRNPIGQNMKINGTVFTVVGVLEETDGGTDQSDDDQVIIPIGPAKRILKSAVIRNFSVQAVNAEDVETVMSKLNALLTGIFKDETTFRVFNQAQMLSTLSTVTGNMMVVLGGIAAISLIVGGIGIMNIMLVSVTERTKEIGIRKAIGAKKKSILIQFLIEAVIVTGLGGIIGILVGVSIIKFIIGGLGIVPEVYSVTWTLLSFGISLIVGVIFGMFPAYKAASLKPIDALRTE